MSDFILKEFKDGYAIKADSTNPEIHKIISDLIGPVKLIVADPPYGNVVSDKWDRCDKSDDHFASWLKDWTVSLSESCLIDQGAMYVWGGLGSVGFRPFFKYLSLVEVPSKFELANLITWKKKRAYGVQNNYLFTREECAYFIKGNAKKPLCFNIPLLDEKRGYSGYNKKYPAKSEFYRRTNVWTDITEMMKKKVHTTQKAQKLHEIMIEIHTDVGDWVIDPFSGAGTTAFAARKLGRKFVIIENDDKYFSETVERLLQ